MATRRWLIPLLAGLLVAMLFSPAAVTAAEPRITTASIMVPASQFIPVSDQTVYENLGVYVTGTDGALIAPVTFPVAFVRIKKITLYAVDDNPGQLCVTLYRSRPVQASGDATVQACTANASAPQIIDAEVDPRLGVAGGLQGAYLRAVFTGSGPDLYGVKITYSY